MNQLYLKLYEHRQIETERLILRPLVITDADDMLEYAGDEENTRFVFPTHQNLNHTKHDLARFFLAEPLGKYAMVLKKNRKMIGTLDYHDLNEDTMTGELGYILNKKYWGQGLATEACRQLLVTGFEEIGFNRLIAKHQLENTASGRVLTKSGLEKIATMPYSDKDPKETGKMITWVIYQLTKEQYRGNKSP
ncbi:GNAT family N-acetyltransferase [Enterococcus sp. ALS3]|uniref:GNAT family N-acetyltransferase n=1 Tax=Enterococcus alishanensis TaxID=1303817 RepID=A0ABS6TC56_9ENTE|nr:GNAT family N-acetyltransferase [Enterococcus alishanensis]MBV7390479.1 GNAT family N-acetyltransferase [Enterococcus alishanensis]